MPGGTDNTAAGPHSLASGRRAQANHSGSFVWGDNSAADIASTRNNQWTARATGGVCFLTNIAGTTGCSIPPGGAWNCTSDRASKANIVAVDPRVVLNQLAAVPVQLWNYRTQDARIKHIGPMAQDFHRAFGVGENDTTISSVDADGVTMAAVQGLYAVVREKEDRIGRLEHANQAQREEIAALARRLGTIERSGVATDTGTSGGLLALAYVFGALNALALGGLALRMRRRSAVQLR